MTLTPLLTASGPIQIHAFSAIAALFIGAFVLWRRKGTRLHKTLGRVWVVLMLAAATSSLFINEIRLIGPFSPIHIFAIVTYAGIAEALWHIRHGNVRGHRASMQGVYIGALILAGAFTFLPGRRMYQVFFGDGSGMGTGWVPSLVIIGLSLTASAAIYMHLRRTA